MLYKSSTDQWPIRLDSNGNPLSNGRLRYTNVSTVDVPKAVYFENSRIYPVVDFIYCDSFGRTTSQVFLGEGTYMVVAEKFNGDILDPQEQDYSFDNQWIEYGLSLPTLPPTNYDYVNFIEDLRLVNPLVNDKIIVLDYHVTGDLFPRYYVWGAYGVDNGGDIIEHKLDLSGAWHLHVAGNVTDCRIFGIFGDGITDNTTQIVKAIIACNDHDISSTLYFPSGIYRLSNYGSLTFNAVEFDSGCYFTNSDAGDFALYMNGHTIINHNHSFAHHTSIGHIFPDFYFAQPTLVNYRWSQQNGEDMADVWIRMNTRINSYCSINVTDMHIIGYMASTLYINNPIVFASNACFHFGSTGASFIFNGNASFNEGARAVIRGRHYRVKFVNSKGILASWYENPAIQNTTIDLGAVIFGLSTGMIGVTKFIFDIPNCLFTTALSAVGSNPFIFSGIGKIVSPTNKTIYLKRCDFGDTYNFTSNGIICGTPTKLCNFVDYGASQTETNIAFTNALFSATHGSGELDLCNLTTTISNNVITPYIAQKNLIIHSGIINLTDGAIAFTPSGAWDRIILSDIKTTITGVAKYIGIGLTSDVFIGIDKLDVTSTSGSFLAYVGNSGTPKINISNSQITMPTLADTNIVIPFVNLNNNRHIEGNLSLNHSAVICRGNNIVTGSAIVQGQWIFTHPTYTLINANRFSRSVVTVGNNLLNSINPVFYGNQFSDVDASRSQIKFTTSQTGTFFSGASVVGNSFTGNLTTDHIAIIHTTTGSGSFANSISGDTVKHRLCIASNSGANSYRVVPITRGTVQKGRMISTSADSLRRIDLTQPGIFYLVNPVGDAVNFCQVGGYNGDFNTGAPKFTTLLSWSSHSEANYVEVAWGWDIYSGGNLSLPQASDIKLSIFQ